MGLAVKAQSPSDIARQLHSLGVPPEALTRPESLQKTLPPQARKLVEALSGFSSEELGAVRKALKQESTHSGAAVKAENFAPRAGVGGAGVNRFALHAALDKKPAASSEGLPKDVQKLMKLYLPDVKEPGRPMERLLAAAARIDTLLRAETDPKKLIDVLSEHDARRNVFQLEGFLKLYKGRLDSAGEHLGAVKTLEDALGHFAVSRNMTELAQKQGAPASVVKELKKTETTARAHLQEVVEKDWIPQGKNDKSPALKSLLKDLASEDWGSYKKDHKFIESSVGDHLHKMETRHYDMRQLDSGIHELRRHMRWVPLYIEALDGKVQLSETHNPVAAMRGALDTPMAQHQNAQLTLNDREESPIRLSKATYVTYLQAVEDLGQIKDNGEQMHLLSDAYLASGAAKTAPEARAAVTKLLGKKPEDFELEKPAKKIYDHMREVGLLNALRKDFLDG